MPHLRLIIAGFFTGAIVIAAIALRFAYTVLVPVGEQNRLVAQNGHRRIDTHRLFQVEVTSANV